jgi:hypothetical protein
LTATLTPGKPFAGHADTDTVMLDLYHIPYKVVKYWAFRTMRCFHLGGFLIMRSSYRCYHVVFNRSVSWPENLQIDAWAAIVSNNRNAQTWCLMQCIKGISTLRVSVKQVKLTPRIVCRYGNQDGEIAQFLRTRRRIKRMLRKVDSVFPLFS